MSAVMLKSKIIPPDIKLRETVLTKKEEMMKLWDFTPTWQNNFEAISRNLNDFKIIGAFHNNKLTGYGIIEPATGDIPQLAVCKVFRRKGIGTIILRELLKHNKHSKIQVINTETTCEAMTAFLESNNIPKRGMQFEMIKEFRVEQNEVKL